MTYSDYRRGALADQDTGRYDPLFHLSADVMAGTFLRVGDLRDRIRGLTRWNPAGTRTITLARGMYASEMRSTLAHELVHVERGLAPEEHTDLEEAVVELIAASRLLAVGDLSALASTVADVGVEEAAVRLRIDEQSVRAGLVLLDAAQALAAAGDESQDAVA